MSMLRFGRKAGSNHPFAARSGITRERITVVAKEVSLGNHPADAHFAPEAQVFVPAEELYDNRRRKQNHG